MELVVYYSRKGHIKKAAEAYAAKNGCKILEIKGLKSYSGAIGFIKAGAEATQKKCPPIEKITADLSSYSKVTVFTPVWAGTMASPVRTFLKEYGNQIKNIGYVIMRADRKNDFKNVFAEMDDAANSKHIWAVSLVQGELL